MSPNTITPKSLSWHFAYWISLISKTGHQNDYILYKQNKYLFIVPVHHIFLISIVPDQQRDGCLLIYLNKVF
jgi:hypothetical protein